MKLHLKRFMNRDTHLVLCTFSNRLLLTTHTRDRPPRRDEE